MKNPYTPVLNECDRATINRALQLLKQLLGNVLQFNRDGLPDPKYGICKNWQTLFDGDKTNTCYRITQELARDWPESSHPKETWCFPIKITPGYKLWSGPNLDARISLMRYMIKRLRDRLRRMP